MASSLCVEVGEVEAAKFGWTMDDVSVDGGYYTTLVEAYGKRRRLDVFALGVGEKTS